MNFDRVMPDAWRVFFRHRLPRPIQALAMPPLLQGRSALLSSPTASGKTEAVFAPLYQRHVSFLRPNLSVVYVAPTKALVNDMYERLLTYFGSTATEAIQRYTGDHHEFNDPAGKFSLLATPEALDSLQLMRPGLLRSVRAVICDEIHLLHGTARGQQLRAVIARIRSCSDPPPDDRDGFQAVGMTATVRDQDSVARLWFGPDAAVITAGEPRPIEMQILPGARRNLAPALAAKLRESSFRKVLLFSNTRNGAHRIAAALDTELRGDLWPAYLHIGILSRSAREQIERAMKRDSRGICVATSTLEVGIDIGDIDLVILCEPPGSVSGFLQRLGRGNRRSDSCVVWACAGSLQEQDLYRALLHCDINGILDDVHEFPRYSVEFQQTLSLAWKSARSDEPLTMEDLVRRSGGAVSETVIRDMLATGVLREIRGALIPGDKWMDEGDSRRIHSVIVGASGLPLVDLQSGEVVGLADHQTGIEGLIYAGTKLRAIKAADRSGIYLESPEATSKRILAKLPSARGRKGGLSRQVVWALGELAGENPRVWRKDGSRLVTWGGMQYNRLLAAVLVIAGQESALEADDFGISGMTCNNSIQQRYIREIALETLVGGRIPSKLATTFLEPTRYLSSLSRSLQNQQAQNSIPQEGFLRWLSECCET